MKTSLKSWLSGRLIPLQWRLGKDFRKEFAFLSRSQWFSVDELLAVQTKRLQALVRHCYENVPYYSRLFRSLGVAPDDIRSANDLKILPFLTKDIVREHSRDLVARTLDSSRLERHTTGGTSGNPLAVYVDPNCHSARRAFEWRYFNWSGYGFGDPCAVLRGARVPGFETGRRTQYDPTRNYLFLSSFDLTETSMDQYIRELRRFRPVALRGYPSSLEVFAKHVLARDAAPLLPDSLRAIHTSSESIYPYQRQLLRSAFGAPVYDLYGNTEQTGRFGQCDHLHGYHEFVEYAVVEIDKPDSDGFGEIVGTSLSNMAMPLLRYKTGDLAKRCRSACGCGRRLPMIEAIRGRAQDFALAADGTPVPMTAFFFAVHVDEMRHMRKVQFRQSHAGKLQALVVPASSESRPACRRTLELMNSNVRGGFELAISFVDEIPATTNGKHRLLVSEIPRPDESGVHVPA